MHPKEMWGFPSLTPEQQSHASRLLRVYGDLAGFRVAESEFGFQFGLFRVWLSHRLLLALPQNSTKTGPAEPDSNPSVQGSPDNPGHWIELGSGRPMTRIHLCELEDHRVDPGPTGITLLTDNILAEYGRLKLKGVRFINSPKEMEWGEWLCEFLDPDGNEFDLKQPVEPEKWTVR